MTLVVASFESLRLTNTKSITFPTISPTLASNVDIVLDKGMTTLAVGLLVG